jgi:hypothetical protein
MQEPQMHREITPQRTLLVYNRKSTVLFVKIPLDLRGFFFFRNGTKENTAQLHEEMQHAIQSFEGSFSPVQ